MKYEILFFSNSDEYAWLSNFARLPIVINGITYPTVEHYYQSEKATNQTDRDFVRNAKTPGQSKFRGNQIQCVENWDEIKVRIMTVALLAKLKNNPELKIKLEETKGYDLIENNPRDYFWGCGKDKSGKNMLGKLWMDIRDGKIKA